MSTDKKQKKFVDHQPGAAGPGVPVTGFNFVEDAYQQRRRESRNLRIMGGAFVGLWFLLIAFGFLSDTAAGTNKTAAETARGEATRVNASLSEALGGVTDLGGHLKGRRDEIDQALNNDMSTQMVINDLFGVSPADIRLISIVLTSPGAPTDAAAPTTTVATGKKPEGKSPIGASLVASGEGTAFASASAWKKAAEGLPYLSGVVVNYRTESGGNVIPFSLTATVDMTVLQQRRQAAGKELGFKPAPPTTAPATTAPAKGGK